MIESEGLLYVAVQQPLHKERFATYVGNVSTSGMDYSSGPRQRPKKLIVEEVRNLFPQCWLWASEAEDGYVSG